MNFDDAFAPLSPDESSRADAQNAAKGVQSSLWRHLQLAGVARAGHVAWALVRCGQRDSNKCGAAIDAIGRRPPSELDRLIVVVGKAHESKRANDAWRALTSAISAALRRIKNEKEPSPHAPIPGMAAAITAYQARSDRGELTEAERAQRDLDFRRMDRLNELLETGLDHDAASAQMWKEIPDPLSDTAGLSP